MILLSPPPSSSESDAARIRRLEAQVAERMHHSEDPVGGELGQVKLVDELLG